MSEVRQSISFNFLTLLPNHLRSTPSSKLGQADQHLGPVCAVQVLSVSHDGTWSVRTVGRTYQTCMQDLYHMDGICTMFTSTLRVWILRAQSGVPSVEWSFQIRFRSALNIPNSISRYFRLVCQLQCHLFSIDWQGHETFPRSASVTRSAQHQHQHHFSITVAVHWFPDRVNRG